MTIQSINGLFYYPLPTDASNPNNITVTLDSANESFASIIKVSSSGTITSFGFKTGTVTTGAELNLTIESVNTATGVASGNVFSTAASGILRLIETDDNVWKNVDISSGVVVNNGDLIAIRLTMPSSAGILGMIYGNNYISTAPYFPYSDNFLGNVRAKFAACPTVGIIYSDSSCAQIPSVFPVHSMAVTNRSRGGNNAEIGNNINLPFPVRVTGWWSNLQHISSNGSISEIKLYDADSTNILAYSSVSANMVFTYGATRTVYDTFNTNVTLSANTTYKITHLAVGATNCGTYVMGTTTPVFMSGMPGGTNCTYTQRPNTGTWLNVNTAMACIGIIGYAFDDGTAPAGPATNTKINIGASLRAQI